MNQDKHIELYRTFHQFSSDVDNADDESCDYVTAYNLKIGKTTTWGKLAEKYRVIILAEAGAGKTQEIRQAAIHLRNANKAAFFIRLEYIADNFEISFEEGSIEEFENWLESNREGWILLDSVDEAKLKDPRDFEKAVRKISALLSGALERVHIIITSRISAWRTKTDLNICNSLFSFEAAVTEDVKIAEENNEVDFDNEIADENELGAGVDEKAGRKTEKKEKIEFTAFSLDDLSQKQIEIFIRTKGVVETAKFIDDIERHEAWKFTTRPQDLEDLVEFWKENGRVGTHFELMQHSVKRRLTEAHQNRAHFEDISPEELIDGVMRVAAAVTFTHESAIGVLDGVHQQGISIREILPEWTDKKCQVLLTRPIFDEAIYGAVRFHHRSVREFLTAQWMNKLLERGGSRHSIESLLFRKKYGVNVVTPSMKEVLSWLILFDEKIRDKTYIIDSEIIFECGDPSRLPKKMRCDVLRRICINMSVSKYDSATSYKSVQRFSNVDIADEIKNLLIEYKGDNEVIPFLIRMIWLGQISGLIEEAKCYALDSEEERYTRIAAIRAVRALGKSDDCIKILNSVLDENESIDRDIFSEIVEGLDPSEVVLELLFLSLAKVKDKEKYRSDGLNSSLTKFVEKLSPELMARYLEKSIPLLATEPFVEHRLCEVSIRYYWLISSCLDVIERLVLEKDAIALSDDSLTILSFAHVLNDYHDYDLHKISKEFTKMVPAWWELNHALFWKNVEVSREAMSENKGERLSNFWQVSIFGRFWEFDENSFDYIKDDIINRRFLDDKLVALSLAFQLYKENGRIRKWREELKIIVKDQNINELQERLYDLLKPPAATNKEKSWKRQEAYYKRQNVVRKKLEASNFEKSVKWLSENVSKLFDKEKLKKGEIIDGHVYLLNKMRENSNSHFWANGDWENIESDFGTEVARTFRDGLVYFWRYHKPNLKSEKDLDDNSVSYKTILGLVGLEIESKEVDGWLDKLSEKEVEIACSYAFCELNGFPNWFPQLYSKFPIFVKELILKEIIWELEKSTKEKDSHYIISNIAACEEWLSENITQDFIELLRHGVENNRHLECLIKIVQGNSKISNEAIADIVCENINNVKDQQQLAIWYAVWMGVQPNLALSNLSKTLALIDTDEAAVKFAMLVVTHIVGGRYQQGLIVRDAYKKPKFLKELHLLMHKYIQFKDDIDRTNGGVYSPELRDDAQDARDRLVSILKDIPGKESYQALIKLSKAHSHDNAKCWINALARKKAEGEADIEPWGINKFINYAKRFENNDWWIMKNKISSFEKVAGFIFGLTFFVILLLLAIFIPDPTPTQYATFRTILAVSAAGVGGILTGFIHVEGKIPLFTIKAGGALALFIIVYFVTPEPPELPEVINNIQNSQAVENR